MSIINAKGLTCPMPVILAKNSIKDGNLEITITVDNEVAKQNLQKLAKSQGYEWVITKEVTGEIELKLTKSKDKEGILTGSSYTLFVASDKLGEGEEELSKILMKSYFYALSESEELPEGILFMNSGVRLLCKGSDSLESLGKLKSAGVELIACGTCLDYYNLKDELSLGEISNMYSIIEKLNRSPKVIRI